MNLSTEERVAIALIDYINGEPEHANGLCFYLSEALDYCAPMYGYNDEVKCFPYAFVTRALEVLPEFGHPHDYIGHTYGYTTLRQCFAVKALELLETGRLYDDPEHGWVVR